MADPALALVEGLNLGPEFLASKVTAPRVAGRWIARKRLFDRLGIPPARALTLISAPPGFGKSSLLASWCRELVSADIRPAWLSVDEQDSDLHLFLVHVAAALNVSDAAIGADVIELVGRRGRSVSPTLVLHLLLDSIAAQPGKVVLVIDDYHTAALEEIDQALCDFVARAPRNLHVIVAGRSAPQLRLARLRSSEELVELGAPDLAFDFEEIRAFFVIASGFEPSAKELAQLREFSEGWPACLQVAAISMRRKQSFARALDAPSFKLRDMTEYLRATVLHSLEPELRSFLIRTAILERFSAALAGRVAGVDNARALLEAIERRQLFLVPLDDRGEWFRYHQLFGNCLREELARSGEANIAVLHRTASDWFAEAALWGEAVRHALAADDEARALEIVEGCAIELVRRGDFLTLTGLLRKLPESRWRTSVPLQIAFAWSLAYSGEASEPNQVLDEILGRSSALPDRERLEVESDVLLIRLTIAVMQDDTELAERLLREFDPALADRDAWSGDIVNSCAAFVRLHAGDAHGARQFLPCVYPFKRIYQQVILATSWLREAKPREAEREIARAQELALGEFGAGSISNLLCEALLAATYYERAQFERVEAGVGRRLAMLDEVAPTDVLIPAYCAVAWSRAARGVPEQAEVLLNHLRQLGTERGWLRAEAVALLEIVRLRLSGDSTLELGDIAPRLGEIAAGPMPAVQCARSTAMRAARLGAAVCAAMQRIGDQALGPLAAVVKEVEEFEAPALAMKAELLLARVCWEHHAASRACEALNRAVERATELGMTQTVRDAGEWTRAAGNGAMAALVQSDEGAVKTTAQAGPKREDLSLREMEILQLVGRGFSNKEIGKALKIGPETVKWHLKNLFAKLGVINRMQAVNRARSSALLA